MKEKIIFFGTGEFGATMLDALFKYGYQIDLVITQPDRPAGREQKIISPPVKQLAEKLSIRVEQPETLKNYSLADHPSDLIVVCQYGLIIPKYILDHPKNGSINVHTSLLPKYRGASPIQSALVNGETETGVTIMLMDEKMDHGAILNQKNIPIDPKDNYASLRKKMEPAATDLLTSTLNDWLNGKIKPRIQDDNIATFCKIFTREDGKINWSKSADDIFNLYRGLTPWPGIWTEWNGKRLKILSLSTSEDILQPGTTKFINDKIIIGCGQKSISVDELQLEGKKAVSARDFMSGYSGFNGSLLG